MSHNKATATSSFLVLVAWAHFRKARALGKRNLRAMARMGSQFEGNV